MNTIAHTAIAQFLEEMPLFSSIEKHVIAELASELEVIHSASGDTIIHQYDSGESLYIVMYGKLKAIREMEHGEEVTMEYIGPRGIVGEIALLIDQPRSATVRAIRDSILLKMTRVVFDQFTNKYPASMMSIARLCVKRLIKRGNARNPTPSVISIAIAPASDFKLTTEFSLMLEKYLSMEGPTLYLTSQIFDKLIDSQLSQTSFDNERNTQIISFLQELERKYKFIIYETDNTISTWTLRCFRQADRVLLISSSDRDPGLGSIETTLFLYHLHVPKELVLIHPQNTDRPTGTSEWLHSRSVENYYHVKMSNHDSFERMARIITGRSYALVLSGGGARGLAHIGVLRALEESNIPIDYIAGSSIGALVAAFDAYGMNAVTLESQLDHIYKRFSKLIDLTFPFTSFLTGKHLTLALKKLFNQEIHIEDLWKKYFCISADITHGRMHIHDSGVLWRSIRASISLPAIFPPVEDGNNSCLLVDGAVINNLPVDVMRNKINDSKIIASNLITPLKDVHLQYKNEYISGWSLLVSHLLHSSNNANAPTMSEIIMGCLVMSSHRHQELMIKEADFCLNINPGKFRLLAFKDYRKIVDAGYHSALDQIKEIKLK